MSIPRPALGQVPDPDFWINDGPVFWYQGSLSENGRSANGLYDLEFRLFGDLTNGVQVGTATTNRNVPVANGLFTAGIVTDVGELSYSAPPRAIQVGVRPGGTEGAFTLLRPRQPLGMTPYAWLARNSSYLGGLSPSNFASTAHSHAAGDITSGTVSPARGGLGTDTSSATPGSLLVMSTNGAWATLAPGQPGQVLGATPTDPSYGSQWGWPTLLNQGAGITLTPNPITTTGIISIDSNKVPLLDATNRFQQLQSFDGGLRLGPVTVNGQGRDDTLVLRGASGSGAISVSSNTFLLTSGSNGDIVLRPGAATGNGSNGTVRLQGSLELGDSSGGGPRLLLSSSGQFNASQFIDFATLAVVPNPAGDSLYLRASDGAGTDKNGGDIVLRPGVATSNGSNGVVRLQGSLELGDSSGGGPRLLLSSSGQFNASQFIDFATLAVVPNPAGDSLYLRASDGAGPDKDGGDIVLHPGAATGTGTIGTVTLDTRTLVLGDREELAPYDVTLLGRQGTNPPGALRYSATNQCWEISNHGGPYVPIATESAGGGLDASTLGGHPAQDYALVSVSNRWVQPQAFDGGISTPVISAASNFITFVANPRIGQEVIVDFLEHDPGRPVVVNRVFKPDDTPPFHGLSYKLKAGDAAGADRDGGHLILEPGSSTGSGVPGNVIVSSDLVVTGAVSATTYSGSGAGLTGLNADLLSGMGSLSFGQLARQNTWLNLQDFSAGIGLGTVTVNGNAGVDTINFQGTTGAGAIGVLSNTLSLTAPTIHLAAPALTLGADSASAVTVLGLMSFSGAESLSRLFRDATALRTDGSFAVDGNLTVAGSAQFSTLQLGNVAVSGASGQLMVSQDLLVTGVVSAVSYSGSGAGLTGVVPADNSVTSGKLADGAVTGPKLASTLTASGALTLSSSGSGNSLTLQTDSTAGTENVNLVADDNLNLTAANGSITPNKAISGTVAKAQLVSNGATPSVANLTGLMLQGYAAPTRVTDLANGTDGQVIVIVAGNNAGLVTLQDDNSVPAGNFRLRSNTDWQALPNATLTLCRMNGVWYETTRSQN